MTKQAEDKGVALTAEESKSVKRSEGDKGKKALIILGIILIALLPALGVYYWQSNEAKQQQAAMQKQIDALQKANDALTTAAKKATTKKTVVDACPSGLTPTQIDNVHSAVESMNTAALDQLMTANVDFTAAASGKTGSETKTAAINDLSSFLTGVNASWEWNIAAPTLNTYKTGSYKLYTADDTIFGASIDKHFVSFRVTCGKIDQVFVAVNTDLLQ